MENQWLLQEALDIANYGIVIIAKDRKVLAYNKAYKEIAGYPEEILSTKDITIYAKWSRQLFVDQIKFDKEVGEILNSINPTFIISKLKDGRTLERNFYPIFKNGDIAGWVGHVIDITSTKRKETVKG